MDAVADLLALAIQNAALKEREFLRRERIESLRRLLHTMAGALDVRQVFPEVSEVVRGGLPHDFLVLTAWDESATSSRMYAVAGAATDGSGFLGADSAQRAGARPAAQPRPVHRARRRRRSSGAAARRAGGSRASAPARPCACRCRSAPASSARSSSRRARWTASPRTTSTSRAASPTTWRSRSRISTWPRRAATAARLEAQVATLTRELEARGGVRRVVGHSKQWKDVLAQATRVAQTETTVLLTGESGTGKEVVARFLHHASRRNHGPFTAINCAALPDQLLESELFGHERGAFTGAVATKPGRIEQAAGGVLFLDDGGAGARVRRRVRRRRPGVGARRLRRRREADRGRDGGARVVEQRAAQGCAPRRIRARRRRRRAGGGRRGAPRRLVLTLGRRATCGSSATRCSRRCGRGAGRAGRRAMTLLPGTRAARRGAAVRGRGPAGAACCA